MENGCRMEICLLDMPGLAPATEKKLGLMGKKRGDSSEYTNSKRLVLLALRYYLHYRGSSSVLTS